MTGHIRAAVGEDLLLWSLWLHVLGQPERYCPQPVHHEWVSHVLPQEVFGLLFKQPFLRLPRRLTPLWPQAGVVELETAPAHPAGPRSPSSPHHQNSVSSSSAKEAGVTVGPGLNPEALIRCIFFWKLEYSSWYFS